LALKSGWTSAAGQLEQLKSMLPLQGHLRAQRIMRESEGVVRPSAGKYGRYDNKKSENVKVGTEQEGAWYNRRHT